MASQSSRDWLDASQGREVVFCHACSHEWYRDEYGLICPRCEGDITEIVDPDNDPRVTTPSSNSTSPGLPPLRHADDSDPDEADIEEHMGPHGFHFRRSTRRGSDQRHHDPSIDPVFERFFHMIQNFGQPRRTEGGGGLLDRQHNDDPAPPRIHRTTFTSGTFGGGTASVTIISGPAFGPRDHHAEGNDATNTRGDVDPFQAIFSNVIRDMAPPGGAGEGGPQVGFARSLQDILNLFNPANAMMGDAVYSQEALDRIITQLMEANPQSNAAPPASEEALGKLDRRPVDEHLLAREGGKAECSICIDEMKEGETAVFLPCKHWFHEDCVVLWLKEHNTCPVCRTPIEKPNRGRSRNTPGDAQGDAGTSASGNDAPFHRRPPASFSRQNSDQSRVFNGRYDGGADTPTGRAAADMVSSVYLDSRGQSRHQGGGRLDEALQNVANAQRERDYESRDRGPASTTVGYEAWRLQRRTSHSPTSPRAATLTEQGARMRQRSPSEGNRRGNSDGEDGRQSGPGAWNWLRQRFSGGGSDSNQGSPRGEQ
ncbi:uncharacterized protein UV8b_00929 [Ustilaginoidea virens]|uniref:RING-type E3 ubiquitin transferase n=1 Tax=Ustilaginoidea virens TaxID=1159556 RepID=A0A063C0M5_USTVR|nr:uncharacterized protein UV8b_00929 [Ustilaginoidea virens]QUC16688.1 hypothetical protein UV8b_00929 [Ustilaginoidea virens]GAO15751.1 hypothetical protein UVI_02043230 [Ustilaginoidea virens]